MDHPEYNSSLDKCPICSLIEKINVTKEETIYNAQEQGIQYENNSGEEVVEYYNDEKQKPVDVRHYEYKLKVKYEGIEYLTGKEGEFTINPKEVSITGIESVEREYDGTTDVELIRGELEGIESPDIEDVGFALPTGKIDNKNVGLHTVTISEILLDGEKSSNYILTQPEKGLVNVTITKRKTKIEGITANNRAYNATREVQLNRGSLTRIIEEDNENIDYDMSPTGTIENKNVGLYGVIIPKINLTGKEAENYELQQPTPEEVRVEITKKDIHIANIESTNKEYDGTTNVSLSEGTLKMLDIVCKAQE